MSHPQLRPIRGGLAVVAAVGLGLTMGACSSDDSDASKTTATSTTGDSPAASPTTTSNNPMSSTPTTASSSSSLEPIPSSMSMGVDAAPVGSVLTRTQQDELMHLLGMSSPTSGDEGYVGSSGSFVLQPGMDRGGFGLDAGTKSLGTITAACLGTSVKTDVVVTVTPDSTKPKETVSKTITCPAGADQGYGMKIYSGATSGVRVRTDNEGSKPIAFAVGLIPN